MHFRKETHTVSGLASASASAINEIGKIRGGIQRYVIQEGVKPSIFADRLRRAVESAEIIESPVTISG